MIDRNKRINAFVQLGEYLQNPTNSVELGEVAAEARNRSGWFTPQNVKLALAGIAIQYLQESELREFADKYQPVEVPIKVGVVMAGNLPAVGFHDAMCVLLSGHVLLAKLSKDDTPVMLFLLDLLKKLEPGLSDSIQMVERINEANAYIATGSDNTARYFEYYFAKKPHIIRHNRTSVAVLTGHETASELRGLVDDCLLYFGLGCRNVSKLYVPNGYDFSKFYEATEAVRDTYQHHHKYFNNYEYNRAILLVNGTEHLDNGFLMLTENEALVSPLSVLYYETYETIAQVEASLQAHHEKIQCVVASQSTMLNAVPFGQAQTPTLTDFADGVDTMEFLVDINDRVNQQ